MPSAALLPCFKSPISGAFSGQVVAEFWLKVVLIGLKD